MSMMIRMSILKLRYVYNLEFAEKYNYYDLAIELIHMLFNFYLDKKILRRHNQLLQNIMIYI